MPCVHVFKQSPILSPSLQDQVDAIFTLLSPTSMELPGLRNGVFRMRGGAYRLHFRRGLRLAADCRERKPRTWSASAPPPPPLLRTWFPLLLCRCGGGVTPGVVLDIPCVESSRALHTRGVGSAGFLVAAAALGLALASQLVSFRRISAGGFRRIYARRFRRFSAGPFRRISVAGFRLAGECQGGSKLFCHFIWSAACDERSSLVRLVGCDEKRPSASLFGTLDRKGTSKLWLGDRLWRFGSGKCGGFATSGSGGRPACLSFGRWGRPEGRGDLMGSMIPGFLRREWLQPGGCASAVPSEPCCTGASTSESDDSGIFATERRDRPDRTRGASESGLWSTGWPNGDGPAGTRWRRGDTRLLTAPVSSKRTAVILSLHWGLSV